MVITLEQEIKIRVDRVSGNTVFSPYEDDIVKLECLGCVMYSSIALRSGDHRLYPQLGKIEDYKIGTCYSSSKNTALRS